MIKINLQEIIKALEKLDSGHSDEGVSAHFLELLLNEHEVLINGNYEGLMYLALKLLKLANTNLEGSHIHLDEHSMLDNCDSPLVFAYKNAEWDINK